MKKVKFELQVYCTVGWNDEEDTASVEVDTFGELVEAIAVLQKVSKYDKSKLSDKEKQVYLELKESLQSKSGEEVMMAGEVEGIRCTYEDDRGLYAEMELSDNFGVSGTARVDRDKQENEYKRLLGEAKKHATEIMKL